MNPKRRPQQLDQCQDFWGLNHWIDTHPDQFTLEQVYKRMVEINQGPPEASQLQLCAQTDSSWIDGIGFIHLAQMRGELNLEYNQTYQTALIGLTPALQMPLMRADKHLRQKLVWLMLAQEGNQGLSLAKCDNSATRPAGTMGWSRTLKTCIDEGLIERDQLLDTLLQMLAADFPATRAGWYSRTLRMLAMTPNEAASRQAPLCALLTSPITATTTLAVNELAKTSHTNQLDTTLFLHCCPGALTGTKTNAVGVLKILLDNLNAINPNQIQPLLDLALTFPHPQVQRLALDLAEQSLKAKLIEPTQLTQLLAQTQLDPLTQPTAQKLQATLTSPSPQDPTNTKTAEARPKPNAPTPSPITTPPTQTTKLTPITSHNLYGQTTLIAQEEKLGLNFELLLNYLATNPIQPTQPLTKLATRLAKNKPRPKQIIGLLLQLALNPQTTTQKQLASTLNNLETQIPTLMRQRINEIGALLKNHQTYQLLATPTHNDGTINPLTLVQRTLQNTTTNPLPADLTQALLRLNPNHPDTPTAQNLLNQHNHKLPPNQTKQITQALNGTLAKQAQKYLNTITITWVGQQAYNPRTGTPKTKNNTPTYAYWRPQINTPTPPTNPQLTPLTDTTNTGTDIEPHQYTHPTNPRHLTICLLTSQWYKQDSQQLTPNCYQAITQHTNHLDPLTAQLLPLAMGENKTELRTLGTETLNNLTTHQQLNYNDTLTAFLTTAKTIKLNRWAQAFNDLANLNPQLSLKLLLDILPTLNPNQPGINKLLATTTTQYTHAQTQGWAPPLNQNTHTWLNQITGTTQTAKYAHTLKQLDTKNPTARHQKPHSARG